MRGAPLLAAIGHDRVAGVLKHIRLEQSLRAGNRRRGFFARERSDLAKWMKPIDETDLRFEDVANAGQHALIEQRIGERFVKAVPAVS